MLFRSIGNPLVISPIYNNDGTIQFTSNRLIGHHIGFMGQPLKQLGYRALFSYTRNWGTYFKPLNNIKSNFNALIELTYSPERLRGFEATLGVGIDRGSLIGNSTGAMITIKKTGIL